nr:hypothetical protein [Tanacetum cinerariifolium]
MYVDHLGQSWRTLATIINKSLSRKTTSNDRLRKSRIDIILKFIRIEEDYQEYRHEILDVMLNDPIKRSESYQMFIKYSTGKIPLRRAEAKVYKKKVTLSVDDIIIIDDPGVALKLGKSISLTKVEEAEAARKVHATHARIMTEFVPKSAKKKSDGRSYKGVAIQDTLNDTKPKPATLKPKIKGAQSLTLLKKRLQTLCKLLKKECNTPKLGRSGILGPRRVTS